jgi:hypoxanthine phosphoribosyltransferase
MAIQADPGNKPSGVAVNSGLIEVVSPEAVAARVAELGSDLTRDYEGRDPVLVGVLNAALVFMADLVRHVRIPMETEFLAVSRFGEGGRVGIAMDTSISLEGRHVVLLEDLVDTGLTLSFLRDLLEMRRVASLATVTLIDKAPRRIVDVQLEYRGFEVGEEFLVGYGLDHEGWYRNLPGIWAVNDFEILQREPADLLPVLLRSGSDRVAL